MTSHFIDITIRPDPEFSPPQLLSALYAKLHRVLARLQANDIGVSFPSYSLHPQSLGRTMRLHGSEAALTRLMQDNWLSGMHDHIKTSQLSAAPPDAPHRVVSRRQFKTNAERLRRRRMRRKGETAEEAQRAIPDSVERTPDLPFIRLHSASTGQAYCLFISHGPLLPEHKEGNFNTYGLSNDATIPWFEPFFGG